MYDFDTLYPRAGLASTKWDMAAAIGMPEGVIPFTVADMELRTAPEIIEEVKKAADYGMWGYTHANDAFRETVAGWFRQRHGWPAEAGWIYNTAGVVPAIYTAVNSYTKPGEGVLIQPPVYTPFYSAIRHTGRRLVENPLVKTGTGYEMDLEDMRRKMREARLMILCSPHNPVGRVWTKEELQSVADICAENNVVLFSDEIHCDIIQEPNKFVSVGSLCSGVLANTLIGTSASKSFSLAGLSCSSIFIPTPKLRQAFEAASLAEGQEFNSAFGVVATAAAYTRGAPWLDALLLYIAGNYKLLQSFLGAEMPEVGLADMQGTYLAWLDFSAWGMEEGKLMECLQTECQLYLGAGSMYGTGATGHLRMNLACPKSVLEASLERLKKWKENNKK